MNVFEILTSLERDDDLHLARLMILLRVFGGKKGVTVKGLTKLAKLDFLLSYPTYLERALEAKGFLEELPRVKLREDEMRSVESRMVRFRYGPWDFRYRRFINILVAKGLAYVEVEGRSINPGLTQDGVNLAAELAKLPEYQDLKSRSKLLKKYFNMRGTQLKDFIYETFPEISSMSLGEEI